MSRPLGLADRPHHDGSARYVTERAPALGADVTVFIQVPAASHAQKVFARYIYDGEPKFVEGRVDRTTKQATWWRVDIPVINPQVHYRFLLVGGAEPYRWLNGTGIHRFDVTDASDYWLTTAAPPPAWLQDAVCYQIFPDRFRRTGVSDAWPDWAKRSEWNDPIDHDWKVSTRQLYGGDLPGITEKLDHLQSLGVNVIYLTPVFTAHSAHRYDAATFEVIDPFLGGDAALATLTEQARRRSMRVIGDLTTNHTGNHHEWFVKAQADASSHEAGYYYFDHHPDDYVGWYGIKTLPKLDYRSAELGKRMLSGADSVVGRWLQPPVAFDGWRIDVANMTARHADVELNAEVARAIRATMAELRPDAWLVAEHCYDASADLRGDGWHGTMNYAGFTRPVWAWLAGHRETGLMGFPASIPDIDAGAMATTMAAFIGAMPWRSTTASLTLLDSHDTARFASTAGSHDRHVAGVALMAGFPGVPMVFAGDEVGVSGTNSDRGRQPFPWDESTWDHELLAEFRSLLNLRRGSEALGRGGLRFLHAAGDEVVLERATADERAIVSVSRRTLDGPDQPLDLDVDGFDEVYRYDGETSVRIWRSDDKE